MEYTRIKFFIDIKLKIVHADINNFSSNNNAMCHAMSYLVFLKEKFDALTF